MNAVTGAVTTATSIGLVILLQPSPAVMPARLQLRQAQLACISLIVTPMHCHLLQQILMHQPLQQLAR